MTLSLSTRRPMLEKAECSSYVRGLAVDRNIFVQLAFAPLGLIPLWTLDGSLNWDQRNTCYNGMDFRNSYLCSCCREQPKSIRRLCLKAIFK